MAIYAGRGVPSRYIGLCGLLLHASRFVADCTLVAKSTLVAPAAGACCAASNCSRHSLASSHARASSAISAVVIGNVMEEPSPKDLLRADGFAPSSASRPKSDPDFDLRPPLRNGGDGGRFGDSFMVPPTYACTSLTRPSPLGMWCSTTWPTWPWTPWSCSQDSDGMRFKWKPTTSRVTSLDTCSRGFGELAVGVPKALKV